MTNLRLALAQINPIVGDLAGNSRLILDSASAAHAAGADLFATTELALSGYPLEDLALQPGFLQSATKALQALAADLLDAGIGQLPVIVGHPSGPYPPAIADAWAPEDPIAYNELSVLFRGEVVASYQKHHLPNYAVFDEVRTFRTGSGYQVLQLGNISVALLICEDLWRFEGPVANAAELNVDLVLVLNASPYTLEKDELRQDLLEQRAAETGATIAYVNQVGGQDELVFDGESMIISSTGTMLARANQFKSELLITDLDLSGKIALANAETVITKLPAPSSISQAKSSISELLDSQIAEVWQAIVVGIRDYVEKNNFNSVILGLSGGIDSAVCAVLACDAIGAERVYGVSMPSKYSSEHSKSDAYDLAERLGLDYRVEPIKDLVAPVESQLELSGVAAENLQARIRAIILMAISNQEGQLVLTTGNKTELAVGYSTIYGDSVGGFAPIKDVPKTLVWELAKWRNNFALRHGLQPPIPDNSITKPPSAELRPDQVDQDSLPPYEVLDQILELFIGKRASVAKIVAAGFEQKTVERVKQLVDRSEWKRRQGAIGPKITRLGFGRDRRMPVTVKFSGLSE